MSQKQTVSPPSLKDMLKRNTRINFGIVTAHEELERKLKKLGVEIKPSYNLEPPLGRNPARFRNRNR